MGKKPEGRGVTPLNALRIVLEEKVLDIPVAKKASALLPVGPRISLDLVPVASERVDDLAPNVCHDLGG